MNYIHSLRTADFESSRRYIKVREEAKRILFETLGNWSSPKGDPIPILMPLADGHEILMEVARGIIMQTVPVVMIPITRPKKDDPKKSSNLGWLSQSECRNLLKDVVLKNEVWKDTQYAVMINRDVVLNSTAVADMRDFLSTNPDYGGVAIQSRSSHLGYSEPLRDIGDPHVDIACSMYTRKALECLTFINVEGCNCSDVRKCLVEKNGMKFDYLRKYTQFEINKRGEFK